MRSAATAIVILALGALAGGCGGDDDADQFRRDYDAAIDRLNEVNSEVGQAGGAGESNDAIAKEFDRIAQTTERTRTDLSKLDPPEDAKNERDELLSALQDGADDLRSVADAARSDDPDKANEAVQDLEESGEEITAAEDDLKEAVGG